MFVHRSNRMEVLVSELARVLRTPKLAPLAPETIVVQSAGMERWLSRELSARLGAFAHARFPFPRGFIQESMDAVLGPVEGAERYEREALTFSIAELLGELGDDKGFAAVSNYLRDDPDGLRRIQLAERIANLFDQYAVYRQKEVLDWEAGKGGGDWQAKLWRALVARQGAHHFAARARDFENEFSPLFVARGSLPARVCIVGGASLPPLFLRLLAKIATAVEVHLFVLAPTDEYFGDAAAAASDVHPLLGSLGAVGAALQKLLEDVRYVDGSRKFVEPEQDSVLHRLQADLLHGRVRTSPTNPRLRSDDDSLTLVACHSPMREVEVLHDRLLALFDADPTLRPDDVVVMAPRIEEYAPFIDAVFESEPSDKSHIPYRVADRSERRINVAAAALLSTLSVLRGRFKASEVLDLLQAEPIRARFGIEALELPRIHRWVNDAGIRWGVDGSHRALHGLPADDRNTWRFGLRRLFVGYALSDDGQTDFEGSVPHDDVAGDGALLLGKLAELCETLFSFRERVRARRSVSEWHELLGQLIGAMLVEGESWQLRPLHEAVYRLAEHAKAAKFEQPVSLEVVLHLLGGHLEAEVSSAEFLSGGVTFCAMLPLRSIPFRVVYLLGMNEGEFPRVEKHLDFDKMAEKPRLGDRSQRTDDRYLFLETLLSAREHLCVSYVGRGIADNQVRPPAVVVSELAAAVDAMLDGAEPGRSYLAPLEQPLQPFSPRHFDGRDPRLASFDAEYARGARALRAPNGDGRPFMTGPLTLPGSADVTDVEELVRFLQNPSKFLLRKLGIFLEEDAEVVLDREPHQSSALDRYKVGSRLLGVGLDELDAATMASTRSRLEVTELGRGHLPVGVPGRAELLSIMGTARDVSAAARAFTKAEKTPAQVFTLVGPEGCGALAGALDSVYGRTQVERMYSQIAAKHELATWVRHLAARAAGVAVDDSVLVGRSKNKKEGVVVRRFKPLPKAEAQRLLFELFELYRVGQSAALPLFPTTSKQYVEALRAGGDATSALASARAAFSKKETEQTFGGEGVHGYVQLAFRGRDALSEDAMRGFGEAEGLNFAALSQRVFQPLLEQQEEVDA